MSKYNFKEHAKSEDAILFGQPICSLDWMYMGKDITLFDKQFKKDFVFGLYQIKIDEDVYSFAASEIAPDEWLFYTIHQ